MSAAVLQKHRVVIASLFLPTTINFDEDAALRAPLVRGKDAMLLAAAPSSDEDAQNPNAIALSSPASPVAPSQPNKPPVRPRFDMRLKSIVDDLTLRVESGTPIQTPSAEAKPNPFSSFSALASAFVSQGGSTTPAGPRPSARVPTTPARTRRLSRSSSRIRSSSGNKVATTESSLPEFTYELSAHANGGLNNAIKASEPTLAKKLWVGVLDVPAQSIKEADRPRIQEKLRAEAESVPVWVTEDEFHKHYDVFCHQVLWPSLHYAIPDAPKTKTFYESTSFQQYKAVNQKFADTIVQEYQEGDVIWINDYHLLLVPEMVRAKLPNATIGFFLHVAFPSSEIFRCLSVRESLLRGMLGADLVGFQTHNYARHFRQTVSRILSLEALPGGINLENTSCEVAIFPIGIDVISLADKRYVQPDYAKYLSDPLSDGIRLSPSGWRCSRNGVRHKLLAFETFLEKYPEFQGRAVLIQVALSTTEENEHQVAVFDVVSRINSKFSTLTYQPIVFLHTQDLTFSQYLALLTAADAFFVASLREGMALRTHEFVECQEGKKHPSPLILSEFTGSYSYSGFRSCVSVNPWDARRTADALYTSLTMNEEESVTRWKDLHKHVTTQTAQAFVTSFVSRCVRTHMEHQRREFVQVPQIEPAKILAESDGAKHLIMIDWEGTLWSEDPRITWHSGFTPPPAKLEIVRKLLAKDRNQVWLLSGMGVQGGLEKIAAELPGVGLVAENGCMIKPPGQSEWVDLIPNFNREWKTPAIEILQYYTDRTPGTFIENRGASLCWRFGNEKRDEAAQKWVRRSAAEAQNHIWDSLGEQYGLRIIPGQSSFLILPKNVSRSTAVGTILSPGGLPSSQSSEITSLLSPVSAPLSISSSQAAQEAFGAILYIGADEHLIRRLNELPNVQTCAAGERDTFAHWRVHTADLGDVLGAFSA
ncbi:glycosyltransferase family 20 protein [Ceratobasidium sp. AG-Ba]|nr:glycosyltransferase family 20 protein [Ceratobasidium sp. AG-Ba]